MTAAQAPDSAVVDLIAPESPGGSAYVLVKQTFTIADGACVPAGPEPLLHDMRGEGAPPPVQPDTDFWPRKEVTDVVVQGAAFCARAAGQREVCVTVAGRAKRIHVSGPRLLRVDSAGRRRVEGPERFEELPLTYANAYGGCDWQVQPENPDDPMLPFILEADHPGLYPRNPFGKGYLVQGQTGREVELPNLEDPGDLLSADRLVTGDPALWYRQPLPWCLDWVPVASFPRYALMMAEADAWFPGPEDEQLPEVKRGYLPAGYRSAMLQRGVEQGPDPLFFQGGTPGMVFSELAAGAPVEITGMHPGREQVRFTLPPPPNIRIAADGDWQPVQPRLHHVVCRPDELTVNLVYGAERELPRPFIPGVHKHIPVAATVDGQGPFVYRTPPTAKEQLEAAESAGREE